MRPPSRSKIVGGAVTTASSRRVRSGCSSLGTMAERSSWGFVLKGGEEVGVCHRCLPIFVAMQFVRNEEGDLVAGEAQDRQSAGAAESAARRMADDQAPGDEVQILVEEKDGRTSQLAAAQDAPIDPSYLNERAAVCVLLNTRLRPAR